MDAHVQLLDGLTEAQQQVIRATEGPVLVLAGPGSGKTTVVTRRMAHLALLGVPTWQMLALTFTNKAAAEMGRRVTEMLGAAGLAGVRPPLTSTFHAFCARVLRQHGSVIGLRDDFTMYDQADQREAIRRAVRLADLDEKHFTPAAVGSVIGRAKQKLIDAEMFARDATDFRMRHFAKAYRAYEKFLADNDAVDFDDLLMKVALLLRGQPEVRRALVERFRYLMVDEYQDTNHAQFVIAHELAREHRNICVVGDADQSIYAWRGADISNILDFEQCFPGAAVIPLGQNFRSTAHIVQAADVLIRRNRQRKDRPLSTELGEGERVRLVFSSDERAEATMIAERFRRRHAEDGTPWREMAVLYRTNALSRVVEEAFRRAEIPHVVARGTAYFDRREVRDAMAWLRALRNPADEIAFDRAVAAPPRGLGRTSLERIGGYAGRANIPILSAFAQADRIESLTARARKAAKEFAGIMSSLRMATERPGALAAFVSEVLLRSGLEVMYRDSEAEEDIERLENLRELINVAADVDEAPDASRSETSGETVGEKLARMLERVALVSDSDQVDPERGAVTLMTLHAAKGLEFDCVAVIGLEEGLLPHAMSLGSDENVEEERRLFFVGMTRARKQLLISCAAERSQRGFRQATALSRFLRELPEEAVVRDDQRDADSRWMDPADEIDQSVNGLVVGCRVSHPTFGTGKVTALQPRPRGSTARVVFDRAGEKTLVLEYARLERL